MLVNDRRVGRVKMNGSSDGLDKQEIELHAPFFQIFANTVKTL